MYSNIEIIDGLIHNNQTIINKVYKTSYPVILNWIRKNNGDADDAKDIYHEAFIIIFRKISADDFSLKCSFSTYLFSICKHLWFQELRKRSRFSSIGILDITDVPNSEPDDNIEEIKLNIFLNQISQLETRCRKLLLLYSEKRSLSEIMKIMGFLNTQAVADKKKNCRKTLIKKLLDCKEYKQLLSGIPIDY
jgi:RNA polymerase sigma factor (sigma-70 family)